MIFTLQGHELKKKDQLKGKTRKQLTGVNRFGKGGKCNDSQVLNLYDWENV